MIRSLVVMVGLLSLVLGCARTAPHGSASEAYVNPRVEFLDEPLSNSEPSPDQLNLTFLDTSGHPISLKNFVGKKNVVLVFTRGYTGGYNGYICPYCSTQTNGLIVRHHDFVQRDAEVLVVFPGDRAFVNEFIRRSSTGLADSKVPFPILLDPELAATTQLGIKAEVAKPATYILDKHGRLRFAYVGKTAADRPSIDAMLRELDQLNATKTT